MFDCMDAYFFDVHPGNRRDAQLFDRHPGIRRDAQLRVPTEMNGYTLLHGLMWFCI
jgi:hypothetical protein